MLKNFNVKYQDTVINDPSFVKYFQLHIAQGHTNIIIYEEYKINII